MTTIVLKVYERMGQIPQLVYDRDGKIQNPTQLIKVSEFVFANKFVPLLPTMGYLKVDIVESYEGTTMEPVSDEILAGFKKLLQDKLDGINPPKPLSPLEVENKMLLERLERLEARETNRIQDTTPPKKPAPRKKVVKTAEAPKE